MELTDKQSHYIQNEIDHVMDMIREKDLPGYTDHILTRLEEIRDSIPCCCDQD